MSLHNIHWKGYPHRHLPRIRVASTSTSKSRKRHTAAQEIIHLPFGLALEKATAHQVYRVRRRQKRTSYGSSFITTQRRALLRARQHIQTNGRDSLCAKTVSVEEKKAGSPQSLTVCLDVIRPSKRLHGLFDGAAGSKTSRSCQPVRQAGRYSSTQIPEPFSYSASMPKPSGLNNVGREDRGEVAHVAEIDRLRTRSMTHSSTRRIHDPRLPTKKVGLHIRNISASSRQAPSICSRRSGLAPRRIEKTKQPSVLTKRGNNPFGSALSTAKSVASNVSPTLTAEFPLRSPSRTKALDRFSRELEKHLIAQKAIRDASLATTTTVSRASAQTIVQFLPFVEEFRASGLAVTSSDQCHHVRVEGKKVVLPQTPGKESQYTLKTLGSLKMPSTTPRGISPRKLCSNASDTASSSSVVVDFTPLGKLSILKQSTKASVSSVQKSTKKVLPWLRKGVVFSSTPQTKRVPLARECSLPSSATTMIDFPEDPTNGENKGKMKAIDPPLLSRRGEIQWRHPDYSLSATTHAQDKRQIYSDTPPKVRGSAPQTDVLSTPPSRDSTSPPPFRPWSGRLTSISAPRTPFRRARNNSTLQNPPTTPQNSSQNRVSQLPNVSITDPYDHEHPSVFEEALNEVVKTFTGTEGQLLGTKATTNIEARPKSLSVNTDPVKRFSAAPYVPFSHRNSESAAPAKRKDSPLTNAWQTLPSQDIAITDRDVLKGLQVALAAACDEEVNGSIEITTGRSIRRLLANLSLLDPLGVNELSTAAKRTAAKRRDKLSMGATLDGSSPQVPQRPSGESQGRDRNLGLVAADKCTDGVMERASEKYCKGWFEEDGRGWKEDGLARP